MTEIDYLQRKNKTTPRSVRTIKPESKLEMKNFLSFILVPLPGFSPDLCKLLIWVY